MIDTERALVLTAGMAHHRDCDEFRTVHRTTVDHYPEGRGMWQRVCGECDWRSPLVGPDAKVPHHDAEREVPCVGECEAW